MSKYVADRCLFVDDRIEDIEVELTRVLSDLTELDESPYYLTDKGLETLQDIMYLVRKARRLIGKYKDGDDG